MYQRELALAERLQRNVDAAIRTYWLTPLIHKEFTFNISIRLCYNHVFKDIDELELSTFIDNISTNVLHYDLSALIMISDELYGKIVDHYTTHDINIDIMNLNQPVLSTNYLINPPL